MKGNPTHKGLNNVGERVSTVELLPAQVPTRRWQHNNVEDHIDFQTFVKLKNVTNDSIATIKERVQDKEGIPPQQLRLLYRGKELANNRSVDDCNITRESTIHGCLRGRGGTFHPKQHRKIMSTVATAPTPIAASAPSATAPSHAKTSAPGNHRMTTRGRRLPADVQNVLERKFNKGKAFFEPGENGLTSEWDKTNKNLVVVKPKERAGEWLKKAVIECKRGATVVAIVPAWTSTKWFKHYILEDKNDVISRLYFITNGITFPWAESRSGYPILLVVMKTSRSEPVVDCLRVYPEKMVCRDVPREDRLIDPAPFVIDQLKSTLNEGIPMKHITSLQEFDSVKNYETVFFARCNNMPFWVKKAQEIVHKKNGVKVIGLFPATMQNRFFATVIRNATRIYFVQQKLPLHPERNEPPFFQYRTCVVVWENTDRKEQLRLGPIKFSCPPRLTGSTEETTSSIDMENDARLVQDPTNTIDLTWSSEDDDHEGYPVPKKECNTSNLRPNIGEDTEDEDVEFAFYRMVKKEKEKIKFWEYKVIDNTVYLRHGIFKNGKDKKVKEKQIQKSSPVEANALAIKCEEALRRNGYTKADILELAPRTTVAAHSATVPIGLEKPTDEPKNMERPNEPNVVEPNNEEAAAEMTTAETSIAEARKKWNNAEYYVLYKLKWYKAKVKVHASSFEKLSVKIFDVVDENKYEGIFQYEMDVFLQDAKNLQEDNKIVFSDEDFPQGLKDALKIKKTEVCGTKRKREMTFCTEENHQFQVVGKFLVCRHCRYKQRLEESEPVGKHTHDYQCIEADNQQFAVCTSGCGCIMKL